MKVINKSSMKSGNFKLSLKKLLNEIITQLSQLKIGGKDLRVIKNMYWEQTAAMQLDEESDHLKK